MRRGTLANWLLAAASFLFALALIEGGVRAYAHLRNRAELEAFEKTRENTVLTDYRKVSLRHMIRPTSNRRIVFELLPGLRVKFKKSRVTTNALGFRSPEISRAKAPGTLRIIGLGDSVMFGWGVEDQDCYLWQLQRWLSSHATDRLWDVVNTGVPGYNTVMEVETLKDKGLDLAPDLVVINFVTNDLDLPNFLKRNVSYLTLERSFLWELAAGRLFATGPRDPRRLQASGGEAEGPASEPETSNMINFPGFGHPLSANPAGVLPEYRDMVGIDSFRNAMGELVELSRTHSFRLAVITSADGQPREIEKVWESLGIDVIDIRERLAAYMRENGIAERKGSVLTVSGHDPHPSPVAHEIYKEAVLAYLVEQGLLPASALSEG